MSKIGIMGVMKRREGEGRESQNKNSRNILLFLFVTLFNNNVYIAVFTTAPSYLFDCRCQIGKSHLWVFFFSSHIFFYINL